MVVQKFPGISETPREQQELDTSKQKEKKKKRKEKEELRIEQLETRSNQNFVKRILIEGDSQGQSQRPIARKGKGLVKDGKKPCRSPRYPIRRDGRN